MMVLGIDFETTGLDADKDRIIEVGAVLWDCGTNTPLKIFSELTLLPKGFAVSEEISGITGITPEMLERYGCPFGAVAAGVGNMAQLGVGAIVAHNGNLFDKPFWEAAVKRGEAPPLDYPWIDTYTDLEYPPDMTNRRLKYLASDHGFLNPFPHRAVFDVLTMLRIFSQYPLQRTLQLAAEPSVAVQAMVSYDDRNKASARSYKWRPETKQWIKSLKRSNVEKERAECGFTTRVLV